ncbi:MAG TPA: hypothetical protein VLV16_06655 [Gemmatimonadales bacterium]|nr:hypothetical protein [Gemmatimonadales bacterium]
MLIVVLRLVHIVLGASWVGMMVLAQLFLAPAIADVGPEGGKVMAALQRRKLMTVIPIFAVLTIVSGAGLIFAVYGTMAGFMASRAGQTFALGAALAIVAFVIGITVMRPAMMRMGMLAQDPVKNKEEIQRLRARGATVGLAAVVLLLLAVGAMAVARYF